MKLSLLNGGAIYNNITTLKDEINVLESEINTLKNSPEAELSGVIKAISILENVMSEKVAALNIMLNTTYQAYNGSTGSSFIKNTKGLT